ncbi:MAG: hypothetical protein WDO56_09535 [Gammaproteobacteria bacterium]
MGVDFMQRSAPSFKKAWNNGKIELATPCLFTRQPGTRARSVLAQASPGGQPASGASVTVMCDDAGLVVLSGTHAIGRIGSPPSDELKRINEAGGIALGTVGEIHPISETFDVELH